jgi:hypothetical protein
MNPTSPQRRPRQSPQGDTFRAGETRTPHAHTTAEPAGTRPQRRLQRRPGARLDLLEASAWLGPRDQVLAQLLDEHRTLTTTQITAALFNSRSTATGRLYRLRQAGWLDRFIPLRAHGRLDTHWVLGPLGADWAAHHDRRPPPSVKAARQRREAIAASPQLEHTDGANDVFIALLTHTRTDPGTRLARWWSPARSAEATGQRVHPDGHGVWEQADPGRPRQVGFWLEYDTGTETLERVKDKSEPYRRLRRDGGPDYPVLIWFPTPTREANFHRKLNGEGAHLQLTLATTSQVLAEREGIAGAIWKIAGNGRCRHRLADLPSHHGVAAAYRPGPPVPADDPLYLLGRR